MRNTVAPGPPGYRGAERSAPAAVAPGLLVADTAGHDEVVVFLIGMRLNRLRRLRQWWWVTRAMPRMLAELTDMPDSPLLSHSLWLGGRNLMVSQVWRSAEELGRFARDQDSTHAPAWREFNRRVAGSGDVGIWHETFICPADRVETLYGNMSPIGVGAALGVVPVDARRGGVAERRVQGGATKVAGPGG